MSFPNIKLALVVGICGVAPFTLERNEEIVLGDVIMSTAVVQYDLGRQRPDQFRRKDTIADLLGRPSHELRALITKLQGFRSRRRLQANLVDHLGVLQNESELAIKYPGTNLDSLFLPTYTHTGDGLTCDECGCNGETVTRDRLKSTNPQPMIHFGQVASGNTVMRSGEHRDDIARREGVIAFEMEGAGVWDSFPCVVIKGACDYADSHKNKSWQKYAAATAASCAKAFLAEWMPSASAFSR
jgi:nucleoside phosphorylase